MGKYDSLRESVGGTVKLDNTTKKPSKYDDLKMSMGLIKDTRPVELPEIKPSNDTGMMYGPPDLSNEASPQQELPGRDIPVIGSVLKGLDWFSQTPVQNTIADVGQALYTPGGGLANIGGATNAVGRAISKLAPNLGSTLGGRVAQTAAREAIIGAPLAAGNSLARGNNQLDQAAEEGLYGAAFGGALGAAAPLVGRAFQGTKLGKMFNPAPIEEPASDTLSLPLGNRDARLNAARDRSILPYGDEAITNPYTFKLPQASDETVQGLRNVDDAHGEILNIDNELKLLNDRQQSAVIDQYKLLKEQLKNRLGRSQGSLIKNADGEVTNRVGRVSNNPQWYREFHAENKKLPNNKELMALAKKHVDEGYQDDAVFIPPWKEQVGYDDSINSLNQVRGDMRSYVKEKGLGLTDARLKSQNLAFKPTIKTRLAENTGVIERGNGLDSYKSPVPSKPNVDRDLLNRALPLKVGTEATPTPTHITKEDFNKMSESGEYFIRTVRTPQKDIAGRTSTPAGRIGIELGLSSDTHKGLSGFNLKDEKRMLEWMGKEGWEHENVAVYKGKPTKEQVVLDPGEIEFNPSELIGYVPTKLFKEHGGDFQKALKGKQETLKTEPTTRPMAEISQPNNPDTILSRLADATKGDQGIGINAFGKRAGMYDNLSTDTKSQLVSKTGREPIRPRDALDTGYRKMVDDLYRFKDYDKTAEKVLGRKLAPSEQTHTLALNSRGSDMITKHILTQDLVDINGNVIGRSLKNATQQIPKKDIVAFEDYQVLRHGMFRMARGEKVYRDALEMTPDKAAQKVAEYERTNPEFKKITEEMYDFRQNLAKSWLVDTGLVDRKTWDGYLENNPFYVPNTRQFSEVEKGYRGGARKGFGGQTSPLKPAPGSQRKIISPIETDIEHVDQYVKAGKRNQVMQNIVKIAQKDPEAFEGFIEIMPMTDNMKQSELKKINEIIANDGIDGLVLNINDAFDQLFNAAKTAGKKDLGNVIAVRFKGEPIYVKVHDAPFLEAITSMTPQAQGVILEAARNTTRVMKLLTTGVNPIFSLTRNLIRDIPMSYVASKTTNNPLRFSYDLLDSVVSILGNKDMYKSFKSLGGGHSSSIAADRNLLAQSKREILPQSNLKSIPARVIGSVENFTNALETAPRLGEFKRLTKAGGNSDDSKIAGLFASNDVTVNFKRRGNVGREVDAFVPYFNAAIQGLDKTFRTFKDQPLAASMKAIAAITVPSVFLYAINHNDPDYKKLDNRTKDLYYLIPKGDGTFIKLPKPREGGVVFGSGVERVLRAWKDKDPEAFKGFAETARFAFSPPVVGGLTKPGSFTDKLEGGLVGDSIIGPLSDIKSNKDFAERPIVPEYMKGLSPELQYDERTSRLSRWIGEKINQSPKQLDYLLKSYSGIIGQLGIPLNSEGGSIKKALITQVTADPTYSNGVFTDFYDIKDKLDTATKDSKLLGKPTKEYDPGAAKFMNGASDRVGNVRKVMRSIQSQPIDAGEKEKKLKELQVLMTAIAEAANEKMKEYKKAK